MDKYIKIGIGVMILDGNKILLGHRAKDKKRYWWNIWSRLLDFARWKTRI